MKYFKLINETDVDKIGNVNGIQSFFSKDNNNEKELLMNKDMYSNISINKIRSIELDGNAIITDVIYHGTLSLEGFIVSKQFKTLVEKFNLLGIQFVDVDFSNRKDIRGYSFMFFNSNLTEQIDYDRTRFGIEKRSFFSDNKTTKEISLEDNNLVGLKKLTKEYAGSARYRLSPINKYQFKKSISYDVFRIGYFDKSFYFSEKICNEFSKHNLTGFYFVESKDI